MSRTNGQFEKKRLHQAEEKDFKNNRRGQCIFYVATVELVEGSCPIVIYAHSLISEQCA